MNDINTLAEDESFALVEPPPDPLEEEIMLSVLNAGSLPRRRRVLSCVTFKMPAHEHQRMVALHERWHLNYSDTLRNVMRKLVPVLASPSGEVLNVLVQLRAEAIAREEARKAAELKRAGGVAALIMDPTATSTD